MIYTYEHVLKLTGEATQQINELLEIDGPLKRSIGRYRKGEKVFLKVSMADNQDVEFSLDDGTLEIESAHHDARSFVIGTEDLEEDIDFNNWWYDPEAQTLKFSEDDDEDE